MSPLAGSVATLDAILGCSSEAIIGYDLDGRITCWSRAAERLLGYTAVEISDQPISVIIPVERQLEQDEVLGRIRRGDTVGQFETLRRRKDGTLALVSVAMSPIRASTGGVVGALDILHDVALETNRDITDRQRAGREIADLQRRLLALVDASGSLLETPRPGDVLTATVTLARELVPADGAAVWRLDPAGPTWQIGAHSGISDAFATSVIALYQGAAVHGVPFSEPLAAEDVHAVPMLEGSRARYESEGICSLLAVPMRVRGHLTGTLVWYHRVRHSFGDVEIQTARAVANLASVAISTSEVYEEQRRARDQSDFLARAGTVLAGSAEYEDTLKAVASLAVPHIADWCAVHIVKENGGIERLAVTHADPAKLELARRLQARYPENPRSAHGIHEVIRTGRPLMMSHISDDMLMRGARDEEHLLLLRQLGIVSYMCVPLPSHGRAIGALTFVVAESGRRYAEADLRFAESVAARAALAIDNARAYDDARRANRLKDEFLANLSHELRTPLNAILGYSRMLRTGSLLEERRAGAVEIVERNAAALAQIVEDLLDVSRIVAGKVRLNVQPVELPGVIADAVATVRPAADAKGIQIEMVLDPGSAPVSGDPDRLQQVAWNLLSNAVKFTQRGGRVQVRLERVNSHIELVVSDTGRGIPTEFLPHVFERFRQGDGGMSRQYGGLGLGLAICRQLVELHGGTVGVASDGEETGATFTVRLPLRIVHADKMVEASRVHPRADHGRIEPTVSSLDGIRVLVVDDEADSLAMAREILESAGAAVTTAASGGIALQMLGTGSVDALIADLGMPGMNGFELIQLVRQSALPSVSGIPAAALTAYARSEDRTRVLQNGFQIHLAKPLDPVELIAAVAALIRRPGARPPDP